MAGQVVGEAQHVGLAVAQNLQQQPGLAFAGTGAVVAGVGQPGAHAVAEPADQCVADLGVDRVDTGLPGEVGVVDQFAQRPGPYPRMMDTGWSISQRAAA